MNVDGKSIGSRAFGSNAAPRFVDSTCRRLAAIGSSNNASRQLNTAVGAQVRVAGGHDGAAIDCGCGTAPGRVASLSCKHAYEGVQTICSRAFGADGAADFIDGSRDTISRVHIRRR